MFVGNFYEIMRSQCANVKEKWRVMRIMMIETAVCCSFQFALHTWNKEEERTHAANDKDWAQSKLDENMLDLDVIMSTKRTLICDDVNISLFCYVQCHRRTTEHKAARHNKSKSIFEIVYSIYFLVYAVQKLWYICTTHCNMNARYDFSLIHDIYWTCIWNVCIITKGGRSL